MSSDLLKSMEDREAALRADMAANPDPRQVELDAIVAMRELYVAKVSKPTPIGFSRSSAGRSDQHGSSSADAAGTSRKSPETLAILSSVRAILENRKVPLTNLELVKLLAERGIVVRGKNPGNSLSAILSNSEEFLSGGRQGWSLKGWSRLMQAGAFERSEASRQRVAAE